MVPFEEDLSFLDPRTWKKSTHEFRIYGDDKESEFYHIVDEEDYHFLIQHCWSPKFSKCGKKWYLRRNITDTLSSGCKQYVCPESGKIKVSRQRVQRTLFLHTVVMLRKDDPPPTSKHHIPDHIDGDQRNCRRSNLRWATQSMNNANLFGCAALELQQGLLL